MTTVLRVPGMMCQHCEKSVKGALMALPGVTEVQVDLVKKTVAVTHEASVAAEAMKAAVEDMGYDVES